MLKFFSFLLLIVYTSVLGINNNPEVTQLFQKAGYELTLSPDKSMEILLYLEKNFSLDKDEKNRLEYLKIKSLFFQNNLVDALQKISKDDAELQEDILILKRSILFSFKIATPNVEPVKNKKNEIVLAERVMLQLKDLKGTRKSNDVSSELSKLLKTARSSNLLVVRENFLYLAYFLADEYQQFSAEFFFKGLLNIYINDPDFEIVYANYLINQNRVEEAGRIIENLNTKNLQNSTNIYLKSNFANVLSNYYAKIGDEKLYSEAFIAKNDTSKIIEKAQFSAKNKWFNIFENKLKADQSSVISNMKNALIVIFGLGIIVSILILIRNSQMKNQIKKYGNFIEKLKSIKEKKAQQSIQIIPKKTEDILLQKLEDFEKSESFINPDISLQTLAKKLETNSKYLSETINNHKQKNFNTYINELRITYVINKLKNDPLYRKYKIKYLAEESGFSTHSAFAAVFKAFTGLSPINYIQLLKDKGE